MSKIKKVSRISLILIGIGLILATTGFFMGGKFRIIRDSSGFKVLDSNDKIVKNGELSSFKNIDVDCNVNNIDIIKSDRYAIEIQYGTDDKEINYTVKDEKLVIKESKISIKGFNIDFTVGESPVPTDIKVYVPNSVDENSININYNK